MNAADATARLDAAAAAAADDVARVTSLDELTEVERRYVGKKRSVASEVKDAIKALAADERPVVGKALTAFQARVDEIVGARRDDLQTAAREQSLARDRLDLTVGGHGRRRGHLHLVTQVQRELEDTFVGLGFQIAEGPEVETDFYNFEALNMPPAHPARSMWDTLYVKLGRPEQVMLRTHTSPVQIRVMQSRTPPIYVVMPGRCYRKETLDARHSPVFHQIEGLVVDKDITFGDLAGTVEAFTHAYFGPDKESRLRPSYFPFTEPSAEFEVTCVFCDGAGCGVCSRTGWIELGGCGMVDPNVFEAVGIDPEEYSGFAFGFGLDRMAMDRFDVDHIKTFFEDDVRVLEQF
ncbi:MAG TPA: phenylalanine--tRNA ligase subunit alpha [Acidimicrobiia bacterium]|nr:phenylalanine--tRNA ligase subunit alpha [Acidimicrobiia bacterium]